MHKKNDDDNREDIMWKLFESVFMYFNARIFAHLGRRTEKRCLSLSACAKSNPKLIRQKLNNSN